jgi:chloramphenicol-sensitive protein RarD
LLRKGFVRINQPNSTREGLFYGLAAYGFWGLVPLYFKAISQVPPAEVLAHRIVWSVVFLALLVGVGGRWRDLAGCFRSRAVLRTLLASTLLIAVNWFVFIYAVSTGRLIQASLGYFITPLVSVLLGLVFLRERLRPGQWLAVALAATGVVYQAVAAGQLPWIALALAGSFGVYGLLRKTVRVDGLIGLSVETLLLLPAALGFLGYEAARDGLAWGGGDWTMDLLLALSGVVTTVPLVCFAQAARRLRLSTLGFLQYLSPSLAFLLAVGVFREEFAAGQLVSFGCIWAGLAIYSVDSVLAYNNRAPKQADVIA